MKIKNGKRRQQQQQNLLLEDLNWKRASSLQDVINSGFKVGSGSISPLESNLDKLKRMKKPQNVDDMQS
jgi:hypothetical protein